MTHRVEIKRRPSRRIMVGNVPIGDGAPVAVQSMTNTETCDVDATVRQIQDIAGVGADLVRVSVPTMDAAEAFGEIRKQVDIPLVTDIHFDYRIALRVAELGADCLRINPGNIGREDRVQDVDALVQAVTSGDIDAIATDHAPHNINDKMVEFDQAPFGIVGLETAVSLIYDRFVRTGILSLERLARLFSLNPARILKLDRGTLAREAWADITVLDPEFRYEVRSAEFCSRSRNTPFEGWELHGGPVMTIVKGKVVWSV